VAIVTLLEIILFNRFFPDANSVVFAAAVYLTWVLLMVGFFFLRYLAYKRKGLL
jgi:hypothetical protein